MFTQELTDTQNSAAERIGMMTRDDSDLLSNADDFSSQSFVNINLVNSNDVLF